MKFFLALLVGVTYFVALFVTMQNYNMFWDGRTHYLKGQAFANFFLYGRTNYKGLPVTKEYAHYYRDYVSKFHKDSSIESRISKNPNYRRSIFEEDLHTFDWIVEHKFIDHPVLSDIGAAFSNIIFYEKLGLLRDDFAYRIYTLILASVLVSVIFYWLANLYGLIPAIVGVLFLATTPLFWAESHFNLKDIPSMTFFTLAIWQFWRGVIKKSWRSILFSAFFAGCAFGTRINIIFLPFIVGPWFIFLYFQESENGRRFYKRFAWFLMIYPLIMFGLIFAVWPQLWQKPIESFMTMVSFYKTVGISPDYTPTFRTIFNFNTYAAVWIFFTTYPLSGILGIIGIIFAAINIKKLKNMFLSLLLLWFFVPIFRASLPFTSIFGGVRHLMEYLPALAMLIGYGTFNLLKLFPKKFRLILGVVLVLGFIPLLVTLIKLHPAENVYFNSLIGGLSGAKKANITGWGYNDGGIYRKATVWLNEHAQKNSHVATAFSEPADFYIPELRYDLLADNQFSGYLQKGEYIVALTHDTGLKHIYKMEYPETFLDPVYEYIVDGVPLIKIWKNDSAHLKKDIQLLKEKVISAQVSNNGKELTWDLGNVYRIIHIDIDLNKMNCSMGTSNFQISKDNNNWDILPEIYPGGAVEVLGNQPKNDKLIAPMAGREARFVSLFSQDQKSCLPDIKNSNFYVLGK